MATETRLSDLKAFGEHKIIFVKRTIVDIDSQGVETITSTSRASYTPNVDVSSLEQEIKDLAASEWTSEVISTYNSFMASQPKNEIEL